MSGSEIWKWCALAQDTRHPVNTGKVGGREPQCVSSFQLLPARWQDAAAVFIPHLIIKHRSSTPSGSILLWVCTANYLKMVKVFFFFFKF